MRTVSILFAAILALCLTGCSSIGLPFRDATDAVISAKALDVTFDAARLALGNIALTDDERARVEDAVDVLSGIRDRVRTYEDEPERLLADFAVVREIHGDATAAVHTIRDAVTPYADALGESERELLLTYYADLQALDRVVLLLLDAEDSGGTVATVMTAVRIAARALALFG